MKHANGKIDALRRPAKSVGYWNGLYSFDIGNSRTINLEDIFFSKIDNFAAVVFQKLSSPKDFHLSRQEPYHLAIFIMSLLHRSPDGIKDLAALSKKMLAEIRLDLRERYAEIRGSNDPLTVEEFEKQQGNEADVAILARQLPSIIMNENIIRYLSNMNWIRIERSHFEKRLLLSDDPIIRTNGLKQSDGHIAFPVNPDYLVVGTHTFEFKQHLIDQDEKFVFTEANKNVVQSARHFVVSYDRSQTRFINNRFGSLRRPTLGEQILANNDSGG